MATPQQEYSDAMTRARSQAAAQRNTGYPPSAQDDDEVPFVPWARFLQLFDWRQSQHIGMIGPTDSGKSTLAIQLLDRRQYVVAFLTKPRDENLNYLADKLDYRKMLKWKDYDPDIVPRRALWPDATDMDADREQKKQFLLALSHIYKQGGWCVYFDELWYLAVHLKMEHQVKTYFQQVRSMNISVVAATQRPAWVPLEVYNQSSHLFFWRDNDRRNLDRISGTNFRSSREMQYAVSNLGQYEVLYVHVRNGLMLRTIPPPLEE